MQNSNVPLSAFLLCPRYKNIWTVSLFFCFFVGISSLSCCVSAWFIQSISLSPRYGRDHLTFFPLLRPHCVFPRNSLTLGWGKYKKVSPRRGIGTGKHVLLFWQNDISFPPPRNVSTDRLRNRLNIHLRQSQLNINLKSYIFWDFQISKQGTIPKANSTQPNQKKNPFSPTELCRKKANFEQIFSRIHFFSLSWGNGQQVFVRSISLKQPSPPPAGTK